MINQRAFFLIIMFVFVLILLQALGYLNLKREYVATSRPAQETRFNLNKNMTDTRGIKIIMPVLNTIGEEASGQVKFRLTPSESERWKEWSSQSNKSCAPKFEKTNEAGIIVQAEFNQKMAAKMNLKEEAMSKLLKETKGFPSDRFMKALSELIEDYSKFEMPREGEWKPSDCEPGEKLLILVPYRNRAENILYFLFYMHQFLQKQQLHYQIIMIEQLDTGKFRRANLFNGIVSELIIKRNETAHCFALHDIDKIPHSPSLLYKCRQKPLQICRKLINSKEIIVENYYAGFFGGVTLVNRWSYFMLNGMSNDFAGWGGEDDDFQRRTQLTGVGSEVIDVDQGRFFSIDHRDDRVFDEQRTVKVRTDIVKKNLISNGLFQVKYFLKNVTTNLLFTAYGFKF